jgi:hypothetical protein
MRARTPEFEQAEIQLRAIESRINQQNDRINEARLAVENFNPQRLRAEADAQLARLSEIDAQIELLSGASFELSDALTGTGDALNNTGGAAGNAGAAAGGASIEFNRLSLAALDAELSSLRLAQSLATTGEARLDLQQQIETVLALREAMRADARCRARSRGPWCHSRELASRWVTPV